MTVREQAWQALQSSSSQNVADAEAALRTVLDGLTAGLTLAGVSSNPDGTVTTYVFTDGDVHLGLVRRPSGDQVRVVSPDGTGRWEEASPPVSSLAGLAAYVPLPTSGAVEAWVQPSGAHDAYQVGDVVTHGGRSWRSTVAANVWEPGVHGWVEASA